jgi:hypothetical protein
VAICLSDLLMRAFQDMLLFAMEKETRNSTKYAIQYP